jgi:DNA polymerase-4
MVSHLFREMPTEVTTSTKRILHIDMDSYYCALESRDFPELRGKPLVVGGSRERGVVASASYEARAFGIHSAMPSVTAKKKCPDLIFMPPRFDVYRAVSQQIRDIFHEYTDLVEPLSLDEAYLDVTENKKGMAIATEIAEEIRAKIVSTTGLTASAGISFQKFLAKMASDQRKPNGQFVIRPSQAEAFMEALPIPKFHGIGPATTEKMRRLGIETGADLKQKTVEFLRGQFGKSGPYFYNLVRGIDEREVNPTRVRKSLGKEDTFPVDLSDFSDLRESLLSLVEDVWNLLEKRELHGRTATLKVKYADFEQITRSKSFSKPIETSSQLGETVVALLKSVFPVRTSIRLIGVTMSGFDLEGEENKESDQLKLDF